MAVLYSNNATTTLSAGITSGATTLTVAASTGALFPTITGSDYFYVTLIDVSNNIEIVKVTARASDTFTIVRAQEGTTARAYASADKVELRVTAAGLANKLDKDTGGTLGGKLVTAASATGAAGLSVPHGTAPTSPVDGEVWTTTAGMFVRVNGATVGPLVTSASPVFTGIPAADTAVAGTSTTQLATTAFVQQESLPSIQTVASAATVTPTFSNDQVNVTALATNVTLANPTGTAVDGWGIALRIKDNGTARTISYGTNYRAIGVTLPTTTVGSKTLYFGCVWNSADTKFDVVAVAQEA